MAADPPFLVLDVCCRLGLSGLYLLRGSDLGLTAFFTYISSWLAPISQAPIAGPIIEFGDAVVMSVLWCCSALLALQRLEVVDVFSPRKWFSRSALLTGLSLSVGVGLFLVGCSSTPEHFGWLWPFDSFHPLQPHDHAAHRDWAAALAKAVTAPSSAAAASTGAGDSSMPCVDTSALRCGRCNQCLYHYSLLTTALVAVIAFIHVVLVPRWYPPHTTHTTSASARPHSSPKKAKSHASPSSVIPIEKDIPPLSNSVRMSMTAATVVNGNGTTTTTVHSTSIRHTARTSTRSTAIETAAIALHTAAEPRIY